MKRLFQQIIGGSAQPTSGAASTTLVGDALFGLEQFDALTITAKIVGPTGGTVDVYLERQLEANVWAEYCHFPQVAAGATKYYSTAAMLVQSITEIGAFGTDSAATGIALAANTILPGHPGPALRLVTRTGAGVSVAGTVTIYVQGTNVH